MLRNTITALLLFVGSAGLFFAARTVALHQRRTRELRIRMGGIHGEAAEQCPPVGKPDVCVDQPAVQACSAPGEGEAAAASTAGLSTAHSQCAELNDVTNRRFDGGRSCPAWSEGWVLTMRDAPGSPNRLG